MKKFRIGSMPTPVSEANMRLLAEVETATVGHARHWGFMSPELCALNHSHRIVGAAVTLALPPQDSTLLHHVIGSLEPGHVIVVDRLGDRRHACWGGGVTLAAQQAGATAAIIDGACTDPAEIKEYDFPIWCRGVSPITTRVYGLGGLLNMPVSCGGVVVNPGDIILADVNGVLVIAPDEVDQVADYAIEKQRRARENVTRIIDGALLGDLSGASKMVMDDIG